MTRDAFLQHLGAALDVHAPEAERALTAVFRVFREAISAGEVAELEARLVTAEKAACRASHTLRSQVITEIRRPQREPNRSRRNPVPGPPQ